MKKNRERNRVWPAILGGAQPVFRCCGNKMRGMALALPLLLSCSLTLVGSTYAQGPHFEWAKSAGGTGWDNGYAITADDNGNTYTTGLYRDTADFDPGPNTFNLTPDGSGGNNLFISKLDALGDFLWAKKLGSTKYNYAYSITHDGANNIYVTGYFYDSLDFDPGPNASVFHSTGSASTSDVFILKLDSEGNFLWARNIGGASNDQAYSVAVDTSNNVYVTGKFFGTVDFDPGPNVSNITPLNNSANIFILKLDAAGEYVWARNMGQVTPVGATGTGFSIAVDGGGNVYSTGYFRDTIDFDPGVGQAKLVSKGNDDIYISKLDAAGNFAWARSMGSARADQGLSIALDAASNVYVTGIFNDSVDFDPGVGTAMLLTNTTQNSDVFILKLDSAGAFLWAKGIKGTSSSIYENNYSFSIRTDKAGNSYTTGYLFGYADFDPGPNTNIVYANGSSDIFILKLNPAGAFKWVQKMGGPALDVSRSSAVDASGNLYTTGWFSGVSDFDPGAGTSTLSSNPATQPDIMVVKLSCGDTTSSSITDSADCNGYVLNDSTYTASGTYIQKVPNAEGCDSTITLYLTIIQELDITVTRHADTLGTAEHFASYQWILNGQAIAGATDSTYLATENGDYQVVVSNQAGCVDTSDVYHVSDITGIEDVSALAGRINIYPNPARDVVYIQSPIAVNVVITGMEGRVIGTIEDARSFSIKSLAVGIYMLRISNQDGMLIETVKMVKQ